MSLAKPGPLSHLVSRTDAYRMRRIIAFGQPSLKAKECLRGVLISVEASLRGRTGQDKTGQDK